MIPQSRSVEDLVEVTLSTPDKFLQIKETLERIGIASDQELFQSCHILHKKGRYYLVHFKEMFALDGKPSTFDEDDRQRRNLIAFLLDQWGLLEVVDRRQVRDRAPIDAVTIVPHRQRSLWTFTPKYTIGQNNK